ncbi:MAG: hypothetical protein OXD43_05330 [Bacteroidetes bacterium]|nr:hypothetical protein [Bacteroidota bacterium]
MAVINGRYKGVFERPIRRIYGINLKQLTAPDPKSPDSAICGSQAAVCDLLSRPEEDT